MLIDSLTSCCEILFLFSVTVPPVVVMNPPKAMAFVVGESIEMPCVADGEPDPT